MKPNIENLVGFTFLLRGIDEERKRILLENTTIENGQVRMEDPMDPNIKPTPVTFQKDSSGIVLVNEYGVVQFSI